MTDNNATEQHGDVPLDVAGTTLSLASLPECYLWHILSKMDLHTFLVAREVCKSWHALATDDALWKYQAEQLYPASTLQLGTWYSTYKHMVMDCNKQQAAAQCKFEACMSTRRTQQEGTLRDECTVSHMHVCRATGTVRVYFHARTSYRPERSALALAIANPSGRSMALDDVMMTQQACWCELQVDQPGMFSGCLVWANIACVVDQLQRGPPQGHFITSEQSSLLSHGSTLLLSYASPLPVLCEYTPATLLRLAPRQTLHQAMMESGCCSFVAL